MKNSAGFQALSEGISPNSRTGVRHYQSIGTTQSNKLGKIAHASGGAVVQGHHNGGLADLKGGNSTPNKTATSFNKNNAKV